MKTINLILFGVMIVFFNNLSAQNGVWTLPPNYSINNTISLSVYPLPTVSSSQYGYHGDEAKNASNAMQDANGDLLFFIVDGEVYDKEGYLIGDLTTKLQNTSNSPDRVKGTAEIAIIPQPDNCDVYYIVAAGSQDYSNTDYN